MKRLEEYIIEAKETNKTQEWLKCVKKMYEWYCENYKNFYDKMHFYSDKDHKKCELIDDKETIADCSGFIAACLYLAGYTKDTLLWNARLGSFNHYKNSNVEDLDKSDTGHKEKLLYMADLPEFECHKISDENKKKKDLSEIKAGDILVKGSHVTIAADDGAKHLYDWGSEITHENNEPVEFYIPKDKDTTYPYRSYWRLK